jgi:response regulator NasT
VVLKLQNSKLQSKIEELRLVGRAKCAMIQYLNMTEAQAHRYIEKQAMDMRASKREIAQGILRNYES